MTKAVLYADNTISFAGRSYPQLRLDNQNGLFRVKRPDHRQDGADAHEPYDPRLDQFVGRRVWGEYTDRQLLADIDAATA